MVKPSTSLIVLAAAAPLATAGNCKRGLFYCGHYLLKIGNYNDELNEALARAGQPNDTRTKLNSLYFCTGEAGGKVEWTELCPVVCKVGATNQDDYCASTLGDGSLRAD